MPRSGGLALTPIRLARDLALPASRVQSRAPVVPFSVDIPDYKNTNKAVSEKRRKHLKISEPAKQSLKTREPKTCKSRPDKNSGSGARGKTFIPWCDK